jgi:hypothetical protein
LCFEITGLRYFTLTQARAAVCSGEAEWIFQQTVQLCRDFARDGAVMGMTNGSA